MANEKRLISADDFKKAFYVDDDCDEIRFGVDGKVFVDFKAVQRAIDEAPTVDAVEVVHGRWNIINFCSGDTAICSVCGYEMLVNEPGNGLHNVEDLHYCPNCGAKMDGGNDYGVDD